MQLLTVTYTVNLKHPVSDAAADEAIEYIRGVLDTQVDPIMRRTVSSLKDEFGLVFREAELVED